jgi:hypothetical protein
MKIKDIHLLAYYVAKPRNPRMTHIKGYMTNPDNITYDERIEFTKGLNPKEQSYAKVVLNLNQKKVIKNSWNTDRSFDEYFKYFLEAYPQYVMNVMGQLDMEYLVQFIPKEEPTTEENIIDVEVKEDGTIQTE